MQNTILVDMELYTETFEISAEIYVPLHFLSFFQPEMLNEHSSVSTAMKPLSTAWHDLPRAISSNLGPQQT
eukprot:1156310-Pelagomonas_calceolata.AAC.3